MVFLVVTLHETGKASWTSTDGAQLSVFRREIKEKITYSDRGWEKKYVKKVKKKRLNFNNASSFRKNKEHKAQLQYFYLKPANPVNESTAKGIKRTKKPIPLPVDALYHWQTYMRFSKISKEYFQFVGRPFFRLLYPLFWIKCISNASPPLG